MVCPSSDRASLRMKAISSHRLELSEGRGSPPFLGAPRQTGRAQGTTVRCPQHCASYLPILAPKDNPILKQLLPEHQKKVLNHLSPDLPLAVTANLIDDESYWRRCCTQRWPVCHVDNHGGSWKRMFFELHLENLLKHFIPNTTNPAVILSLLPLCRNYVRALRVDQFLPPVQLPAPPRGGDQSDSGSEGEMEEPAMDHYQLDDLVAGLSHLEELDLVYGVKDCGMNFEWNLFLFTYRDCHSLAATVKACHTLKVSPTPSLPPPPILSVSLSPSPLPLLLHHRLLAPISFSLLDQVSLVQTGFWECRNAHSSARPIHQLFIQHSTAPRALS